MIHRPIAVLVMMALLGGAALHSRAPAAESAGEGAAGRMVAKWTPRPLPEGEVNLLAMGDWGDTTKEQKVVAENLAKYAAGVGTQFNGLVSLGDNFYVSLKSEKDPHFRTLFEEMYDPARVNFPFFAALGNHDYEKDKARFQMLYARNHPDSRWKLPNRWYRMDFPAERPLVTLLVLDSNKPKMSSADWKSQMLWMEYHLSAPRESKWIIAAAHHPLFSNGSHGDNGVLQKQWGPLFQKHKLDFYLCGHDHDLQHLQIERWHPSFIISGGGGKTPTKMRRDKRGPFSRSLNGFAHLRFTEEGAEVKFINGRDGQMVHDFTRARPGDLKIIMTTGGDKATNKPLKALLGLDQIKSMTDADMPEKQPGR